MRQGRPYGREPPIQEPAREVIAEDTPRLGVQTSRPAGVPPARVDLAAANGVDVVSVARPGPRRKGARRTHGRRI